MKSKLLLPMLFLLIFITAVSASVLTTNYDIDNNNFIDGFIQKENLADNYQFQNLSGHPFIPDAWIKNTPLFRKPLVYDISYDDYQEIIYYDALVREFKVYGNVDGYRLVETIDTTIFQNDEKTNVQTFSIDEKNDLLLVVNNGSIPNLFSDCRANPINISSGYQFFDYLDYTSPNSIYFIKNNESEILREIWSISAQQIVHPYAYLYTYTNEYDTIVNGSYHYDAYSCNMTELYTSKKLYIDVYEGNDDNYDITKKCSIELGYNPVSEPPYCDGDGDCYVVSRDTDNGTKTLHVFDAERCVMKQNHTIVYSDNTADVSGLGVYDDFNDTFVYISAARNISRIDINKTEIAGGSYNHSTDFLTLDANKEAENGVFYVSKSKLIGGSAVNTTSTEINCTIIDGSCTFYPWGSFNMTGYDADYIEITSINTGATFNISIGNDTIVTYDFFEYEMNRTYFYNKDGYGIFYETLLIPVDLDSDGDVELIVGTPSYLSSSYDVFNPATTYKTQSSAIYEEDGTPFKVFNFNAQSMVVHDVNDDGIKDVCYHYQPERVFNPPPLISIGCYIYDGVVNDYEIEIGTFEWGTLIKGAFAGKFFNKYASIIDVNNDGTYDYCVYPYCIKLTDDVDTIQDYLSLAIGTDGSDGVVASLVDIVVPDVEGKLPESLLMFSDLNADGQEDILIFSHWGVANHIYISQGINARPVMNSYDVAPENPVCVNTTVGVIRPSVTDSDNDAVKIRYKCSQNDTAWTEQPSFYQIQNGYAQTFNCSYADEGQYTIYFQVNDDQHDTWPYNIYEYDVITSSINCNEYDGTFPVTIIPGEDDDDDFVSVVPSEPVDYFFYVLTGSGGSSTLKTMIGLILVIAIMVMVAKTIGNAVVIMFSGFAALMLVTFVGLLPAWISILTIIMMVLGVLINNTLMKTGD